MGDAIPVAALNEVMPEKQRDAIYLNQLLRGRGRRLILVYVLNQLHVPVASASTTGRSTRPVPVDDRQWSRSLSC